MSISENESHIALRNKIETDAALKLSLKKALDFLPNSEYELILFMSEKGLWIGDLPSPPKHFTDLEGGVEFGLFLFWFHNQSLLDLHMFSHHKQREIKDIIWALHYILQETKFNTANYKQLESNDLIYKDGTVLSMETYATFDQKWFIAFLNLMITTVHKAWYNDGKFPTVTPPVIPISGKNINEVKIAIIGDWGAGNENSQAVMDLVVKQQPDYIVHVGDTYYGGTPLATDSPHGKLYFDPGEEMRNLVEPWPTGFDGKSFTLNSNHEMYSGANGLFLNAYGAKRNPVGADTPFSAHKGSSCFALKFGDFTLLGLDTAYDGKVKNAFMAGSLGAADGTQATWIKSLNLDPNKTIVLSHHNGFEDDTKSASPLWAEIQQALGGDPFAWYWGHVHNGIVYNQPITIPTTDKAPGFKTNTFARCLGHASLPYGVASTLNDPMVAQKIAYKTSNIKKTDKKDYNELYNGFAMLNLTLDNGAVSNISEAFYDVSGVAPQPAFKKSLL